MKRSILTSIRSKLLFSFFSIIILLCIATLTTFVMQSSVAKLQQQIHTKLQILDQLQKRWLDKLRPFPQVQKKFRLDLRN